MITNTSDISLALAVWLVKDDYDYIDDPDYASATSLMKPLKQILLAPRVDKAKTQPDVADFISRALGSSLHDSIEKAWTHGYPTSLKLLGYPDDLIERVRINPTDEEVRGSNSIIPVYLEKRIFRTIVVNGRTIRIGGKYDMVTDGMNQDTKSTSAFTWLYGGREDGYQLQMSIYRWIDAAQDLPKITEDFGRINFIFTDWQRFSAKTNPAYPQKRVEHKDIPLMSLNDTEAWLVNKISMIQRYKNVAEPQMPECSDEELWRSAPSYKYFSDPEKAKAGGRSTRNFEDLAEANAFMAEKGKGIVKTIPSEPKRCGYCEVFDVCSQKDKYFPS